MKRIPGLLALFFFVAFAVVPAVANAHQGNSNYRSEINSIRPASLAEGLDVSVVNFDDHVRLVNETGEEVVILGYDGEPLARILTDGTVEENLNSPAYYLNQDRFADVEIPERADEKSAPDWKEVGGNGTYEWHDHRSHYMGEGLPPQVKDESVKTKVFDYAIPVEVGGKPARIEGTLTWVGSDSNVPVIPFVILGLAVAAAAGFWIVRRRRNGDPDPDRGDAAEKEAW